MISFPNNKVLVSRSFGSFEELTTIARAWDADFRQVSQSQTNHQVLQVVMDGVLMSRGRFGCHLEQRGNTPKALRTFALLEEDCAPVFWFGRRVGPEALLVFPTHGEIEAISGPAFNNHTFSIAMDHLAEFFERSGGPDLNSVLGPEETVVPLAPGHLLRLRQHLRKVSFAHRTLQRTLVLFDAYREKLFALLLEILRSEASTRTSYGPGVKQQTIRDVIALVHKSREERLNLEDLCVVAKVPERTLNETFRRDLGMSPGAFVKGSRLYHAHRELWYADPSRARVADIANSWGFWHMGQFAADYRQLFGELPRETLKRSPTVG